MGRKEGKLVELSLCPSYLGVDSGSNSNSLCHLETDMQDCSLTLVA